MLSFLIVGVKTTIYRLILYKYKYTVPLEGFCLNISFYISKSGCKNYYIYRTFIYKYTHI